MSEMIELLKPCLGLGIEAKDLTVLQVTLRGLIVFTFAIAVVRVADKRFLAHKTAFDAVLLFILASMLSRAINGSAAMLPTFGGSLALVVAHRFLAHLSFRWHSVGVLIKGRDDEIVRDGQMNKENMRKQSFSEADLLEALRLRGKEKPEDVRMARLERSGELSVVAKKE